MGVFAVFTFNLFSVIKDLCVFITVYYLSVAVVPLFLCVLFFAMRVYLRLMF